MEQDTGYWILGYPGTGVKKKQKSRAKAFQLGALYKCEKCNSVWECYYRNAQLKRQFLKYTNIPSYGLERRVCQECKGECNG
jgi:hypothetical protein|tara:strand:+ start:345 stop:590 length:246 start_codon:yes stop_codon:yes gene_type:complete